LKYRICFDRNGIVVVFISFVLKPDRLILFHSMKRMQKSCQSDPSSHKPCTRSGDFDWPTHFSPEGEVGNSRMSSFGGGGRQAGGGFYSMNNEK
jgi:hypothetical protein